MSRLAPDFTLEHVAGGWVSLRDYRGRPLVFLFGGRGGALQAERIARIVGVEYPPDRLPIVVVLHLPGVPRPLRGLIRGLARQRHEADLRELATHYGAQGQTLPGGPAGGLAMLLDWEGWVAPAYGLPAVDHQVAAVAIDAAGQVLGAEAGRQLLALMEREGGALTGYGDRSCSRTPHGGKWITSNHPQRGASPQ